jgi:hypothetical protein
VGVRLIRRNGARFQSQGDLRYFMFQPAGATTTAAATAASRAGAGNEAPTGRPAAEIGISDRDGFLIECLRDTRYHEDRERYFAKWHKFAMFVVVVSGTATFANWASLPWIGAIVTLAGLLDLVFDVSGKARSHASLRRRVYDIMAQMEDPNRTLDPLREQLVRVYADEPPTMHAANIVAFNGAMDFLHRPREFQYKLKLRHRIFRNVWSFASTDFKTYGELAKPKIA